MLYENFKKWLLITATVFVVSWVGALPTSAYGDDYLNNNLPSGISSAVSWDNTCRTYLSDNINSGQHSSLRSAINNGAAYQTVTWISSDARGNAVNPIRVNYGDTKIRLRLNMVVFLCGPMVQPQFDDVCGNTWVGGYQILSDLQRWVLSPSSGNDRAPNNRAGCMYPSMTYDYRKFYDMKVSSSDFTGVSLTSHGALNGRVVLSEKNPYTRYWFSTPVYFDVSVPGGIKNSGTVRVSGSYSQINGYHQPYPANGNSYCLSTGPLLRKNSGQIDDCQRFGIDYSISVELNDNYNLVPTINVSQESVDAGQEKISGISASFGHNGSTTKSKNNDKHYAVIRYKVPKGKNLVLPAKDGITTWGGNWPCEAIRSIDPSVDCQGDVKRDVHKGELQLNETVTMLADHTDDISSMNLQLGDKVCYVAMVSAYNQNADYRTFKTTQAQCITVGKTPKVQVWGGDVRVGKEVKTKMTNNVHGFIPQTHQMSRDELLESGLWPTGYNAAGKLLKPGGNETDGHWSIICASGWKLKNIEVDANQWAYDKHNTVRKLPRCGGNPTSMTEKYQAVTIFQNSNAVGKYPCPHGVGAHIIGDIGFCPYGDVNGPWSRLGNNARWVGLNYYGLHTDDSSGQDPSKGASVNPNCGNTPEERVYNCGNMYVFRLDNIKFKDIEKYKNIKITMRGAVDNLAKVLINGHAATMSGILGGYPAPVVGNYVMPGWGVTSSMTAELSDEIVKSIKDNQKNGKNNILEVRIMSDHSYMGLLIEDVEVSYVVDSPVVTSYGSWAEYGIIAKGSVASSSGAGLSSSYGGRSVTNEASYNKLTFANKPNFGQFSPTLTIDNYAAPNTGVNKGNISGSVNVGNLQHGNYRVGNLTIAGGTVAVGRSVVIESTGTVTISGNIKYAATNDSSRLPQLIIKAKNIVIDPGVTDVNAWLITDNDGYVSTCGAVANTTQWLSSVNPNSCNKRLKINGPIKAGHLFLRRTYGAQHATAAKNDSNMHPGTPAEILNLRADNYMWAYNLGRNDGTIKTAYIREMAPRY